MTELQELTSELLECRELARSIDVEKFESWMPQELVRLSSEIRWCVDALTELDMQLRAVQRSGRVPS
jgi:hypothetical protein